MIRKGNNNRYLRRVTLSVARTVIIGGPDVQIELDFRSVGFLWREENRRKTLKQDENQQQTQNRIIECITAELISKEFTILYQGPKTWNSLPVTITSTSSFPNFKKKLLDFLVK